MKACGRCCLAPVECYTHHTKRFAHTARGHSSTIEGVTLWSARVGVDSATAERAKARSKSASLFTTAPNRSSALCRRCASCFLAFAISCAVASHTSQNTRGSETAAATQAAPLKNESTNAWHLFAAACHLARRMWVSRSPTLRARARMASVPSCLVSACCVSATDCTVFWRATKSARTQRTNERNARERRHKQLQPLRSAKTPHPWQA